MPADTFKGEFASTLKGAWIATLIASLASDIGTTVFAGESVSLAGQIFRDCSDCPAPDSSDMQDAITFEDVTFVARIALAREFRRSNNNA
jgi:hypothetical protein